MRFSWKRFLDAHRIEYLTLKHDLMIRCPLPGCYKGSGKNHMGVSLNEQSPSWHCWACNHGGKRVEYLIRALLNCTRLRAAELAQEYGAQENADDFATLFDEKPDTTRSTSHPVVLPITLHPITPAADAKSFYKYLAVDRGFSEDAGPVASYFNLMFARTGMFAGRVVYPVYQHAKLMSYTGRTIHNVEPRYLTAPHTDLKKCVGNFDNVNRLQRTNTKTLVVVEGPMDLFKLDYYGKAAGVRAVCTFGVSYTMAQVALLADLLDTWYERLVVVYDKEADMEASQLAEDVRVVAQKKEVDRYTLTEAKDPGALTAEQVEKLAERI